MFSPIGILFTLKVSYIKQSIQMSHHVTTNHDHALLENPECRPDSGDQPSGSSNSVNTVYQLQNAHLALQRHRSTETSSSSIAALERQSSAISSTGSILDSEASSQKTPVSSAQIELRKQIMKIQSDPTIPAGDKAKKIQARRKFLIIRN